jgi:hypothetical protein
VIYILAMMIFYTHIKGISTLFPGMLEKTKKDLFPLGILQLDEELPESVTIEGGYLLEVTFYV